MKKYSSVIGARSEAVGIALGALGVLVFSFSLPAARLAVPSFGGLTVGMGRTVIAGGLAVIVLIVSKTPMPRWRMFRRLAIVAGGVVFGFPILTSFALVYVPASRGAIVVGLLPAATALVATFRHGEKPSLKFWLASGGGLITVVGFAIVTGDGGGLQPADGLLLLAVIAGGFGYAEGGTIAKELGGWQTISWALVMSLPLTVPITIIAVVAYGPVEVSASAVFGLAYLSVFAMYLGFFAWYAGMSMGGVAKVSQIQLAQPLLTLAWAGLFLGEELSPAAILAAILVVGFVIAARRAPVYVATSSAAEPDTSPT